MSEVELRLVNSSDSCTMYTIQFLSDVQKFENLLQQEIRSGNVEITEK